ncbi:MAG TPA: hypothetical protein DCQ04_13060 [Actinobacteria bacterium]|jgi:hypothetical protein|nr:hypothetical protein [Actinomycetota bacterium]
MDVRNKEVRPAWAIGVELRQTAVDCVQVVGDVECPLALRGLPGVALDWLRQLDGARSWGAQVAEAQARGMQGADASMLLDRLLDAELLIDARVEIAAFQFANPVVVGAAGLSEQIAGLLPGSIPLGPLPKPRDGDDWRLRTEELGDKIGSAATIVALDSPWVDAAELELVSRLIDARIDHVVVGAGVSSARVGPVTRAGGGPCVRCDELLRVELDPLWRPLSAQLALDMPTPAAPTLTVLAAAEVVRQITNAAPHEEVAALNAVLTTGYRGGAWRRRPLSRHLKCSCWWPK